MCDADWNAIADVAGNAFATLLAAFLGAWFAFKLQRDQEESKQRSSDLQAANLNLSLLAAQIHQLESIKKHFAPAAADEESRPYKLKPIVPTENLENLTLDFSSLAFALEKNPTLVANLSSDQKDINTAIGLIRWRSQLHIDLVQPAVEQLQAEHGGDSPPANINELIRQKLGWRSSFAITDATDRMLTGLDHAHDVAVTSFDMLHRATLAVYPQAKLVPSPTT